MRQHFTHIHFKLSQGLILKGTGRNYETAIPNLVEYKNSLWRPNLCIISIQINTEEYYITFKAQDIVS